MSPWILGVRPHGLEPSYPVLIRYDVNGEGRALRIRGPSLVVGDPYRPGALVSLKSLKD